MVLKLSPRFSEKQFLLLQIIRSSPFYYSFPRKSPVQLIIFAVFYEAVGINTKLLIAPYPPSPSYDTF